MEEERARNDTKAMGLGRFCGACGERCVQYGRVRVACDPRRRALVRAAGPLVLTLVRASYWLPTRTDSELSPALYTLSIACTLYSVRLGTRLFASVYVVSVLSVSDT